MSISAIFRTRILAIVVPILGTGLYLAPSRAFTNPVPQRARITGHVPLQAVRSASREGRLRGDEVMSMALALPLRNQTELSDLLRRLYDPADPLYGHYLTAEEFASRFGPTQADYDSLAAYAASLGLQVTGTHPNRLLLDVSGPAARVEAAFNLRLLRYRAADGREFYAPDQDPEVPEPVASLIAGVIGLDSAAVWHSQSRAIPARERSGLSSHQVGTGPLGGLTPSDIQTAYNLGSGPNGSGQTLAVFELDGYDPADIAGYQIRFGLPAVRLQNVLVDGVNGSPGFGASEVTLDIELLAALAPGAKGILVYEGPNSSTGVIDTYNRMATDNLASVISTSWGLTETQGGSALLNVENAIFQQMAAQGESIFAASGDSGAYDNGVSISVDDPASQPYVVGTGGTTLFVNADGTYNHETTWNTNNTLFGGAGGGGISAVWPIPLWQQGVVSPASLGSTTMRNVPDVSLDSDPSTGYSVYFRGGFEVFGGTSCAAPLWAAFAAEVNQVRAFAGLAPLGFANPTLYGIAGGADYTRDFHDIADGSTNLFYPAMTGYDDATGWGSFNGDNLLAELTGGVVPTSPTISSLTSSVTSPVATGTPITWTATASGGTPPIQFRFTVYDVSGGQGILVQDWSPANSATWTPTSAGTFFLQVLARNAGTTTGYDALRNSGDFTVIIEPAEPLVLTSLTPTRNGVVVSRGFAGVRMIWTVSSTGGAPPVQFRFAVYNVAGGPGMLLQDWSTANSASWIPTTSGYYVVQVLARNAGTPTGYDTYLDSSAFPVFAH